MSLSRSDAAVLTAARNLASPPDERHLNPEYHRALVELASDLLGLTDWRADDYEAVELVILGVNR